VSKIDVEFTANLGHFFLLLFLLAC